jgi:hypothetical protein
MAAKRRSQEADVISRLADAGEDALRELIALPRRILRAVVDRLEGQRHKTADKLRGSDRLDSRVAELENRLDAIEKPTARRPSTRTTRVRAATAAPAEPKPVRAPP